MQKKLIEVLLVEDDLGDEEYLRELLSEGCIDTVISSADRVALAIELLSNKKFDIILSDLFLPDSQGIDTFLKIYNKAPETPVVVLSGLDDESISNKTIEKGAQDYLLKGKFDSQLLKRTIRYAIERKQIEEKLKRSNAELEEFANIVSHDLQAPLVTISGFANLLSKHLKGNSDSDTDKFIDIIINNVGNMTTLINDLLIYSRVTAGKPQQPINCNEILNHVKMNLQSVIAESKTEIIYDDLPIIMGNFTQVNQLFQNLISNAMKFCKDKQPKIKIEAKEVDREWIFSINDNGIGIDSKYNERIFSMFERLHKKKDYPGTGIGLAICKKTVEHHGGRIWVESKSGEGSTFYFTIPIK